MARVRVHRLRAWRKREVQRYGRPLQLAGHRHVSLKELNEVLKPGDRLDSHGRGVHYKTVDFTELTLYYDSINW